MNNSENSFQDVNKINPTVPSWATHFIPYARWSNKYQLKDDCEGGWYTGVSRINQLKAYLESYNRSLFDSGGAPRILKAIFFIRKK